MLTIEDKNPITPNLSLSILLSLDLLFSLSLFLSFSLHVFYFLREISGKHFLFKSQRKNEVVILTVTGFLWARAVQKWIWCEKNDVRVSIQHFCQLLNRILFQGSTMSLMIQRFIHYSNDTETENRFCILKCCARDFLLFWNPNGWERNQQTFHSYLLNRSEYKQQRMSKIANCKHICHIKKYDIIVAFHWNSYLGIELIWTKQAQEK